MKQQIRQDIKEFIQALRRAHSVVCSGNGLWTVEKEWKRRLLQLLPGREEKRMLSIIGHYQAILDEIERIPVRFGEEGMSADQIVDYDFYFLGALAVLAYVYRHNSSSIHEQASHLERRILALKYRLQSANGGISPNSVKLSSVNKLKQLVQKWKADYPTFNDSTITEHDLCQIQASSQYADFVQLLERSEAVRENFFLWTFRDKNCAQVFIEFPAVQERLVACNLNGRIGRINSAHLQIKKIPLSDDARTKERVVTLPFEGRDVNILDESNEVHFRGHFSMTVDEAFAMFKDKIYRVGKLEYLAHGITNWNVHLWGFWDDQEKHYHFVDFTHNEWWHQLPVFEIITQDAALKRYGKRLDGKQWLVAATATRGSRSLDYENTHAFCEVAIPWGDGRYAIMDFGKFAFEFPSSFFESLSIFCKNMHATIAYPDENVFYSHRQINYQAFVISEDQGSVLMERIKQDMLLGQKKNFVYQIESDNCAFWVHKNLEAVLGKRRVPDMFRMHLLDTEPVGVVAYIFKFIRLLPKALQTAVMAYAHIPLGASKETWIIENGQWVRKSLRRHAFFSTGVVYLPALLIEKKERGLLDEILDPISLFNALSGLIKRKVKRKLANCLHAFINYKNVSIAASWLSLSDGGGFKQLINSYFVLLFFKESRRLVPSGDDGPPMDDTA